MSIAHYWHRKAVQMINMRAINSIKSEIMRIAIELPNQAEVVALITELDAYQDTLYPPESRHALDLTSLMQPNVVFAVARDSEQHAVGCGAVVLNSEFGELKRMYVSPRARNQGIANALLAELELRAIERGCKVLRLETGPFQPEALAFYARNAYTRCGPFADYWDDPLSVFMQKEIS